MTLSEHHEQGQRDLDFRTLVRMLTILESLPRKWWGPAEYGAWTTAKRNLERLRDRNDPEKEQLT